ncbi:MAG: hypothetical protein ABJK59_02580 [Erythrobacter sp.]|uniref:hypothetical protein n=1 Tax=Erythrobacter sp. TaxID=1042 RepID=UPI003299A975
MLIKAALVAICAALIAGVPMSVLLTLDVDSGFKLEAASKLIGFALMGSVLVGLPIALLTYFLAAQRLSKSISIVLLAANLAGAMMVLACVALGGAFAALFLGLPSVLAANAYAVLGWFWILKPMAAARESVV